MSRNAQNTRYAQHERVRPKAGERDASVSSTLTRRRKRHLRSLGRHSRRGMQMPVPVEDAAGEDLAELAREAGELLVAEERREATARRGARQRRGNAEQGKDS